MLTAKCRNCGKKFGTYPCKIKDGRGRYCSKSCNGEHKRPRKPRKKQALRPVGERFWEKVDKSGGPNACWPWTAARDESSKWDYGEFGLRGEDGIYRPIHAHRMAYMLHNDVELSPRVFVRHRCDNPPCCNPKHLRAGTAKQNTGDAVRRGRMAKGERHGGAKLSENQVAAMRRRYAKGGISMKALGLQYRVSASAVHLIVNRLKWGHDSV